MALPEARDHMISLAFERDWLLTPCRGKRPTRKGWTTEDSVPRELLERHARLEADQGNLGLRTGRPSGVIVIDIEAGGQSIAEELGLPVTITVRTGGGGRHLYFRWNAEVEGKLANWVRVGGMLVDLRTTGGQVLVPGSIHPETGRMYVWERGRSPREVECAELPERCLEALLLMKRGNDQRRSETSLRSNGSRAFPSAARGAFLSGAVERVRSAPEGSRNETLNREAFVLARAASHPDSGVAWSDVEAVLRSAAQGTGLSGDEIERTLASARKAGEQDPMSELEVRSRVLEAAEPRENVPAGRPWSKPRPLDFLEEIPRFPLEVLPNEVREVAELAAESAGCHPDTSGLVALHLMSLPCLGAFTYRAGKIRSGASGLYVLLLGDASDRKSSLMRFFTELTSTWSQNFRARMAPRLQRIASQKEEKEQRARSLRNQIRKAKDEKDVEELRQELERLNQEEVESVIVPSFMLSDVTTEAFADAAAEGGGVAGISSAEPRVLDIVTGAYTSGKSANVDLYNVGWEGQSYESRRKGAGVQRIERPAFSILLAAQPDRLAEGDTKLLADSGFFPRFLFGLHRKDPGAERTLIPSPDLARRSDAAIEALQRAFNERMDAIWTGEVPSLAEVMIEAHGLRLLDPIIQDLEDRMEAGGELEFVKGSAGRLPEQLVRLAVILGAWERFQDLRRGAPLPTEYVERAVAMYPCLVGHMLAGWGRLRARPEVRLAKRLLGWVGKRVRGGDLPSPLTARDVYRALELKAQAVEEPLAILENHGWIRLPEQQAQSSSRGGRRGLAPIELHPDLVTHLFPKPPDSTDRNSPASSSAEVSSVSSGDSLRGVSDSLLPSKEAEPSGEWRGAAQHREAASRGTPHVEPIRDRRGSAPA